MKSLVIILASFSLLIYSCQGPVGPEGAPGPQGLPGEDGLEGFTFEYIVDFVSPDYFMDWSAPRLGIAHTKENGSPSFSFFLFGLL